MPAPDGGRPSENDLKASFRRRRWMAQTMMQTMMMINTTMLMMKPMTIPRLVLSTFTPVGVYSYRPRTKARGVVSLPT
jgi:hypothetical protein